MLIPNRGCPMSHQPEPKVRQNEELLLLSPLMIGNVKRVLEFNEDLNEAMQALNHDTNMCTYK